MNIKKPSHDAACAIVATAVGLGAVRALDLVPEYAPLKRSEPSLGEFVPTNIWNPHQSHHSESGAPNAVGGFAIEWVSSGGVHHNLYQAPVLRYLEPRVRIVG